MILRGNTFDVLFPENKIWSALCFPCPQEKDGSRYFLSKLIQCYGCGLRCGVSQILLICAEIMNELESSLYPSPHICHETICS